MTKHEAPEEPKIVDCASRRFFGIVGGGPFEACGPLFGKLKGIASKAGLGDNRTAMLVLCDVPNTAKADLVWACAVEVEDSTVAVPDGLEEIVAPAKRCATTIHRGGYEGLPKSWGNLCMKWVPSQNLKPAKGSREVIHYELYLNSCDGKEAVKKEDLRTQLFCPLEEADGSTAQKMKSAGIYLTFDGNCSKAFEFYEQVFGNKVSTMMTNGKSPMADTIPKDHHDKILHASLDIGMGDKFALMGCDSNPVMHTHKFQAGNNTSITLTPDTMEETKRLFEALSKDGAVTMPLDKQFWGSYFGTCTDSFGIQWMLDFPIPADEQREGDNKRKAEEGETAVDDDNKKAKVDP